MTLFACPVCFGAGEGALIDGSMAGIVALMAVTLVVLGGFASFFLYLRRQAARADAEARTGSLSSRVPTR